MAFGIPWDPWLRYERTCSDTWSSSKCQVWGASATGPDVGSGAPAIVLITERDCKISSANFWAVGSTSVWCSAIRYWSNFWSWSRSSCKSVSVERQIRWRLMSETRSISKYSERVFNQVNLSDIYLKLVPEVWLNEDSSFYTRQEQRRADTKICLAHHMYKLRMLFCTWKIRTHVFNFPHYSNLWSLCLPVERYRNTEWFFRLRNIIWLRRWGDWIRRWRRGPYNDIPT